MNRKDRQRKVTLVYIILIAIVVIVLVIALASGGGGGVPLAQVVRYQPIIPSTTKVIDPDTAQYLTSVSPNQDIFTFSQNTTTLDSLELGDVIVGDASPIAPDGFLRKVEQISLSGGQVIVSTSPAVLTEAIQTGTISYRQRLTPADVRSVLIQDQAIYKLAAPNKIDDEFYVEVKDIVLYDEDNDVDTTDDQIRANGEITLAPTIIFELAIKDFELQELLFTIEEESTVKIEIETVVDVAGLDASIEVARYYLNPITVWVGYVPVVLTPILTVDIGLKGEVSVGIKTDISVIETLRGGLSYQNGNWQPIQEHSEQISFSPPRLSAKCEFEAYGKPRINLLIYGVVGPYGAIKVYLELESDPFDTPWWELYYGLSVEIGVRFEILSRKIADFKQEVIGYRILLAKAESPFDITVTPTNISLPPPVRTGTAPAPVPITFSDTDTTLVIDSSGSMNDLDVTGIPKIVAAKQSVSHILNILAAENQAGANNQVSIVQFNNYPSVELHLSSEIPAAFKALDRIYADNGTGMAGGLRAGLDVLSSTPASVKPIMILLSDGLPNILLNGEGREDYDPQVRQEVLGLAQEAGTNGICIYTIGFGQPLVGGGTIDEELLRQIADISGCGTYYNAQNANELANVYIELRHASTGNILLRDSGEIAQDQEVFIANIDVPHNQAQILYTLNWPGSELEPVLTDPNARIVDINYPGVSISTSSSIASVIVADPVPGLWQVSARGVDIPEQVTTYNAILSARANPAPQPTEQPTETPPVQPPTSEFPLVILIVILAGAGISLYVLSRLTSRKRASVSGHSVLIGRGGEVVGRTVLLNTDNYLIGRGLSCNLRLTDQTASRQHARLRHAQGQWYLQDLGSTAGTFVNDQRVNATALKNGDRICIGSAEFEFHS